MNSELRARFPDAGYIDPTARVYGQVEVGAGSSLWPCAVIRAEGCGFVGCAAAGLEHLDDVRPHQQGIELWDDRVEPEPVSPDTLPSIWHRHMVNNAANPLHLEQRLVTGDGVVRYKVAWVGGANVLFDREKLLSVGGFSWWDRLPAEHAGEEVVVQLLLLRKYGGCAILPSGTYHMGLPTTVEDRRRNATELFADLIEEYDHRDTADVPAATLAEADGVAAGDPVFEKEDSDGWRIQNDH